MTTEVTGFRLSRQQKRLWLSRGKDLAQAVLSVRLQGPIDAVVLRRSLTAVVARHQALRTSFPVRSGLRFPVQAVSDEPRVAWVDEVGEPVPPGSGAAPVEARLISASPDRHTLEVRLAAVCTDRPSLGRIFSDLVAAYAAGGELADADEIAQYVQFSEWLQVAGDEEGAAEGREVWQRWKLSLSGLPASGVGSPGARRERAAVELESDRVRSLESLAVGLGLSVIEVVRTAWQVLLWRLSGQPAIVTHITLDGRKFDELGASIGPFTEPVPVPCALSGDWSFGDAARHLQGWVEEARLWLEHFDREGMPDAVELFEGVLKPAPRRTRGVELAIEEDVWDAEPASLHLSAVWTPAEEREPSLRLELAWDPAVRDAREASFLLDRLSTLLGSAARDPGLPLSQLEMLGEPELRHLLREINQTAADVPGLCVHELFTAQATRTPGEVAIVAGDVSLSYAELAARAHRLAGYLRERGVGPDVPVGLCLERSPELVVAILGVLAAGGAYVPLDPGYPAERLAHMLAAAAPRLVLARRAYADRFSADVPVVWLEEEAAAIARHGTDLAPAALWPETLAYVLFTSGSTGRPKGVMVPHRGLSNYLAWCAHTYPGGSGVPVHSPLGFDLTVTSLFAPLLAGGRLHLLPEAAGIEALAEALRDSAGFGFVKLTPSHLELLREQLGGTQGGAGALVLGGEALYGEPLAAWRAMAPQVRVVNEYGPTETVVGCCTYELPAGAPAGGAVPIGRPIFNTRVYLLDGALRPVPRGAVGSLYVGGAGVTRGYVRNPAATASRFLPDPFGEEPGGRLYATGDLARWRSDGELEYLGRDDHQVKIRGFRVELGEIEAVLAGHPGVAEVAALAREDTPGVRRLVAYLVPRSEPVPATAELRAFLAERLPEYMVPAAFVALEAMPLTANGKVNRAALPAPGAPEREQDYVAPGTPTERALVEVWGEVLGVAQIGIDDSFFALGGDSIRSVRVVALARRRGLEYTVQQLFRFQTVRELAAVIDEAAAQSGAVDEENELLSLLEQVELLSDADVAARLREKGEPTPEGAVLG